MDATRLMVGGLAPEVDAAALRAAFEGFGTLIDATIQADAGTGRSRGFGFITFARGADAERALAALHGAPLAGRTLQVMQPVRTGRRTYRVPSGD
ncbi:MAG: RNA-binding protein [bacterium]